MESTPDRTVRAVTVADDQFFHEAALALALLWLVRAPTRPIRPIMNSLVESAGAGIEVETIHQDWSGGPGRVAIRGPPRQRHF